MPPAVLADLEAQIRAQLPTIVSNNVMIRLGTPALTNAAASGAAHHFLERYLIDAEETLFDLGF